MRTVVFCAVFMLLTITVSPASSALIPYTITGSYYDYSTGLTHQVFGSIIIENQPAQYGHIYNTSTGEFQDIDIRAGNGYLLEDVLNLPLGPDWDIFCMTHYVVYSFSLTSLNDPGVSWYKESGYFRFENLSFQNFYPVFKYSNILYPSVPDLRYYFYYSDMTPYSYQDWWSWNHALAPIIKAHDIYGVDPHGPDGKGLYWNLTLTSSVPTPEPAIILQFGLGLLWLSAYSRRRKSKQY